MSADREALIKIINMLGPDELCDCGGNDAGCIGLRAEAGEALRIAKAALAKSAYNPTTTLVENADAELILEPDEAPVVIPALAAAARRPRSIAEPVVEPTSVRCPSCEHMPEFHSEGGCWFTVTNGKLNANDVCSCANLPVVEPTEAPTTTAGNIEALCKCHALPWPHLPSQHSGSYNVPAATPSPTPPEEAHPEDYCHRCGGPNVSWAAASPLWNAVMRPAVDPTWDGWPWAEIVCPTCFTVLAVEAGFGSVFNLYSPNATGLADHRSDGTVWDSQQWLWVAPSPTPAEPTEETPTGHSVVRVWQERPGEFSWECACGMHYKHQQFGPVSFFGCEHAHDAYTSGPTEAQVEAAAKALWAADSLGDWDDYAGNADTQKSYRDIYRKDARAALVAAASVTR